MPPNVGDEDEFLQMPESEGPQPDGKTESRRKRRKGLNGSHQSHHHGAVNRFAPFTGCVCKIQHKYDGDAVFEVFCPPRLVVEAQARGLKASISLDKDTGWDANVESERERAKSLLLKHKPWLLMVSPECRMYSSIQRNCNKKKMDPTLWDEQLAEADQHLQFAMDLVIKQGQAGRKFVFEHPSGAASWQTDIVQRVVKEVLPEARVVRFAQCRFGLCAPNGQPLQKLTKFMTNSDAVVQCFQGCQCVCDSLNLTHATIEGSMDGHRMSRWAQKYPAQLVSALLDCCQREMP